MKRLLILTLSAVFLFSCGPAAEQSKKTAEAGGEHYTLITKGEAVDLSQHIVAGKVTVFDFYADWCGPCKKLDRSLADLKSLYGDRLVILKLDIVSWDSNLAQTFSIRDLPYLKVYGENGDLIADGPSNEGLPKLIAHLNQS